jgi:hypothetical protein
MTYAGQHVHQLTPGGLCIADSIGGNQGQLPLPRERLDVFIANFSTAIKMPLEFGLDIT